MISSFVHSFVQLRPFIRSLTSVTLICYTHSHSHKHHPFLPPTLPSTHSYSFHSLFLAPTRPHHPHQVKDIFLALPAHIQARILLRAINHPSRRSSFQESTPSESPSKSPSESPLSIPTQDGASSSAAVSQAMSQATVLRDLLSAGGVVAVKLGQMLAEDPNVPADYRRLLGSLRDR